MRRDRGDPRIDVRVLDALEAHLESDSVLGFDLGEGHAVVDFLARLEMGHVEALLPRTLSDDDRAAVLRMVEHRKGQLPVDELPDSEASDRTAALERARRAARRRRGRG